MKNKVQLITYVNRFGKKKISDLHKFLNENIKEAIEGGIHLLPFYYPIDGADAGYDPIDHTKPDERLGSWDDIACLASDYPIMGDIIVNHVSDKSKEFADVKEKGSKSEFYDLFLTKEKVFPNGASDGEIKKIYRPRPNLPFTQTTLYTGEKLTLWTTFTSNQLDIDVNHPIGKKYLFSILEKFSRAGIKMIRLDAAGYVIKKPGTSCFMLPETYAFIDRFASWAKDLGMEVLVEIHSYFGEQIKIAKKVDYVYDFALPPLILHTLRVHRFDELKKWLKISPRNCVTVLDTHDGIGIIDVAKSGDSPGLLQDEDIEKLVESIHEKSKGDSRMATGKAASNLDLYQVNCTYYDALGRNDKDYLMARAIQFFCPGVPQVYYVGLLAGHNDMELLRETKVGRDINRHFYSFEEVNQELNNSLVKDILALCRFRNSHPSFDGEFNLKESTSNGLHIEWRNKDDYSVLKIDFEENTFAINYSNKGQQMLNFDSF